MARSGRQRLARLLQSGDASEAPLSTWNQARPDLWLAGRRWHAGRSRCAPDVPLAIGFTRRMCRRQGHQPGARTSRSAIGTMRSIGPGCCAPPESNTCRLRQRFPRRISNASLGLDQRGLARSPFDRLNPPQATRLQSVVRRVSPGGLQPVDFGQHSLENVVDKGGEGCHLVRAEGQAPAAPQAAVALNAKLFRHHGGPTPEGLPPLVGNDPPLHRSAKGALSVPGVRLPPVSQQEPAWPAGSRARDVPPLLQRLPSRAQGRLRGTGRDDLQDRAASQGQGGESHQPLRAGHPQPHPSERRGRSG